MCAVLLAAGCTWPVRQRTDQTVCRIANQPYDLSPTKAPVPASPIVASQPTGKAAASNVAPVSAPTDERLKFGTTGAQHDAGRPEKQSNELRFGANQQHSGTDAPLDMHSAAWLEPPNLPAASANSAGIRHAAWSQSAGDLPNDQFATPSLRIPARLPGSETPPIELRATDGIDNQAINEIYPSLPPLPLEPRMLPGPDGQAYTLRELQRIAAANSPALRQAVADVQQALGRYQQARTYANPNATYFVDPTNNNATTGVQGIGIEQVILTGGKMKLSAAAAYKDVENAQYALRSARNNLATRVRQAYFALLVDKETLAVTRAVARFTDEIYHLSTQLLKGQTTAAYEPAALRAQAFTTRLAYQQAIATYIYDWKSLVAILSLEQLPLTEVAGRIDRFIPYYDYDQVLSYVKQNHSDILRARNLVPQARYNLKLQQVAVVPDLDVSYKFARDFTVAPFGTYQQFQLQMPLAAWNRNKGNIIAAQAALVRATEEQHNTELDLTNRLADAYTGYQNNLYAIEYYRRYILPDLVRYYRGVYQRRPLDPEGVNVGDLAFAQQNLSQNVTAYLAVLGNLWQSAVGVADFLQTDDLFQMATPRPLPQLPDFNELSHWACGHSHIAAKCGVAVDGPVPGGSPHLADGMRPSVSVTGSVADQPERGDRPEQLGDDQDD